jgi:hypothetical protein
MACWRSAEKNNGVTIPAQGRSFDCGNVEPKGIAFRVLRFLAIDLENHFRNRGFSFGWLASIVNLKDRQMQYLPVFLDLDHRAVLVVGASEKAARKLRLLTRASACSADATGQTVVSAANDDAARDGAVARGSREEADVVVKAGADVPEALSQADKVWTPQEVALATFWVAG